MGKRMPTNNGLAMPAEAWPLRVVMPGWSREFGSEAEVVEFLVRCDHSFSQAGRMDPGGLEARRYMVVRGCPKCASWVLATGPGWSGPPPGGGVQ